MLKLAWKSKATQQFELLLNYVAERNFDAAQRLEALIHERVETLRKFPELGRPGRVADTREIVPHPNYIVVYRCDGNAISVLNVLHARRRYP